MELAAMLCHAPLCADVAKPVDATDLKLRFTYFSKPKTPQNQRLGQGRDSKKDLHMSYTFWSLHSADREPHFDGWRASRLQA
jgi:hypothetical protein